VIGLGPGLRTDWYGLGEGGAHKAAVPIIPSAASLLGPVNDL